VKVEGTVQADGTWLADEIKLIPEDALGGVAAAFRFDLIGEVASIDPWLVSGTAFTVDENTVIDDAIAVGSRVHVSGTVLEDGTFLAESIVLLDTQDVVGCLTYATVVSTVENNVIVLYTGQQVPMNLDTETDDDLTVGAVILLATCTDQNNNITVVGIVVIAHLDELPTPPHDNSGNHENHGDDEDDEEDEGDHSGRGEGGAIVVYHDQGESGARDTMTTSGWSVWANG